MKTGWIASLLFLLFAVPIATNNQFLSSTFTLKIAVVSKNDTSEQFEFHRPNQYTYVKNNRKYHGAQAEKAMNALLKEMNLSEGATIDSLVDQLKNKSFKHLTHLEIRWLTDTNELYTWVWNSD